MTALRNTRFALTAAAALAGIFLVVLVVATPSAAVVDTSIVVNTLDDELNSDGDCSLREAVAAANLNAPVDACPAGDGIDTDTIKFEVSGTILLSVARLLGEAIKRIHSNESVSRLFQN